MNLWPLWLSIRGVERNGLHWFEEFSLSLKWIWDNIIMTEVAWLYLSFLLLILNLFLGLFCCTVEDFVSQWKLLIAILLRRFEKCSNAFKNTNVWTLMKHSLKTLIWWDSTPKFLNSQLCFLVESGKVAVWWMRKMSGHDRKEEMRTCRSRCGPSGWPSRTLCPSLSAVHSPLRAQAAFGLIGPLSDIDCLGVILERQIRTFESSAGTQSEIIWAPSVFVSAISHPATIIPPDTNALRNSNPDSDCQMWCLKVAPTLFCFCLAQVSVFVWAVVATCFALLASPWGCSNHVFLQGIFQLPAAAWAGHLTVIGLEFWNWY